MTQTGKEVAQARLLEMLAFSFGEAINRYLANDTVEEVRVNPDGKLWAIENGVRVDTGVTLTPADRLNIINVVADASNEEATPLNPSFPAELPETGYRFHAVIPPEAPAPTFVIRRKPTKVYDLAEYVAKGEMTEAQRDVILDAVGRKLNILVVGGTFTGKTTLANAILREMGKITGRILTIEDTRELIVQCEEWIALRTVRRRQEVIRSMAALLRDALRLTPDRIVVGEVRGPEVIDMLDAWGTGHPGGLATVHANSDIEGLERVEDLIRQGGIVPVPRSIAKAVNLIVFIGFRAVEEDGQIRSRRYVQSISHVRGVKQGEMGHEYIFESANAGLEVADIA